MWCSLLVCLEPSVKTSSAAGGGTPMAAAIPQSVRYSDRRKVGKDRGGNGSVTLRGEAVSACEGDGYGSIFGNKASSSDAQEGRRKADGR
jgi:hypothetical protein